MLFCKILHEIEKTAANAFRMFQKAYEEEVMSRDFNVVQEV